tara:strand:+ start:5317 stop:8136 length:2820 start_codon:yes stop_codon:yes gene_type:complete
MEYLLPVPGCMVGYMSSNNKRLGVVNSSERKPDGTCLVTVRWNPDRKLSAANIAELYSAFKPGQEVEFVPTSRTGRDYGYGIVCRSRKLSGYEQILVDFPSIGEQHWLPYERLSWVTGPKHRFITGKAYPEDTAERFRLKFLAHAIENWNENTGAFSNLDIDPLPHQVHLVHHILNHGNLNWLIADDVGLGKTIEAGMLIKALEHRGLADRILLVTPAGLTQQWKDEMFNKFGLGDFRIYGDNFQIDESREWGMYKHVIASMDKLKEAKTLASIMQAEQWDLVIFDEAHRLSRTQYGMTFDTSQRYTLAEELRNNSRAMILLSATPHQGKSDKFTALLTLLRPELKDEIHTLSLNPELLKDMMFRNNKADVTDAEGNFIFKGMKATAIKVELDAKTQAFDIQLRDYLKKGYQQAEALGRKGNAIGFVMTVYRKLAASSTFAIFTALKRRLDRLEGELAIELSFEQLADMDARYEGENEELFTSQASEFFTGEINLLNDLIDQAAELVQDDKKLQHFVDSLVRYPLNENSDEKLLIFTEYRSTQQHIQKVLVDKFGAEKVNLINGSMKQKERKNAIANFEENGQFLISTEAGGEGINLQDQCHIMVNYDLPWNPMRLVQRIGRLYRYGQKLPVVVFNMFSPSTADEQIIDLMYQRINQVVEDLAVVGDEFNERMSDDILGQIAELVDIEGILRESANSSIERTKERISSAMDLAKDAASKQQEIFEYARSYDPTALEREFMPTKEHITSFIEAMFDHLDIEVINKIHNNQVWDVRLSESVLKLLGSAKGRRKLTINKEIARNRDDIEILGMDNSIMQLMITEAKSRSFGGITAQIMSNDKHKGMLAAGYLRWQNEEGRRQSQELTAWHVSDKGTVTVTPQWLPELFNSPLNSTVIESSKERRKDVFDLLTAGAEKRLSEKSNRYLHPENIEFLSAAHISD